MKILIIGDNPKVTGGVCNYTRPLLHELSKTNHEISYLYSASRLKADYRLFTKPKIERDLLWPDNFVYKLINSENLDKNFDNLDLDSSSKINDHLFENFIKHHQPDVIHINEIIGFSSNTITIAKKYKIKVIVSIHEYWWLCPKRVMVDYNKKICEGPSDLRKCSFCMHDEVKIYDSAKRKKSYLIRNQFPIVHKILSSIKTNDSQKKQVSEIDDLSFSKTPIPQKINEKLREQLNFRLESSIRNLNLCDAIIAVSNDVKLHLLKYGVAENIIQVQHIGSTIAEKNIVHTKKVDDKNITIGFIGGVSYYKGVHQLVNAFLNMPEKSILKANLKVFGGYNNQYLDSIKRNIIKDSKYIDRIKFFGRYQPNEIETITNDVDIAVLPSLCADTAPQTIFESFSSGLPIIAPSVGGFPDFIKNGVNGRIYNAGEVDSLSTVLSDVVENSTQIDVFRRNIPELKTINDNCIELVGLYSNLLDGAS